MKIFFLLAHKRGAAPNPVLTEIFTILWRNGHKVDLGIAENVVLQPDQLPLNHDLYILKSHGDMWLSIAGVLHNHGATILNPYPPCAILHDKIITSRWLRAAGIPVPRSWVTGDLSLLYPIVADRPLVIKPYDGSKNSGIRIVQHSGELANTPPLTEMALVQEYIVGVEHEQKVYVIGEEVFGIQKIGETRKPCTVSAEVKEIALRCGKVFDLGLYGLDVIIGANGPYVIDVNYFPSYKGIPNVAALLANHILEFIRNM